MTNTDRLTVQCGCQIRGCQLQSRNWHSELSYIHNLKTWFENPLGVDNDGLSVMGIGVTNTCTETMKRVRCIYNPMGCGF